MWAVPTRNGEYGVRGVLYDPEQKMYVGYCHELFPDEYGAAVVWDDVLSEDDHEWRSMARESAEANGFELGREVPWNECIAFPFAYEVHETS